MSVLALYRYAQGLRMHPKKLLEFTLPKEEPITHAQLRAKLIDWDDPRVKKEAFKSLLPVYSLKAAAGYFGKGEEVLSEGWIQVDLPAELDKRMFVARAVGDSMAPKIHDGDLLVFRANPSGSRQGKIVLAQYRGPSDPETGGSYTVKRYHSSKKVARDGSWQHRQVTLEPINPDYEPILLSPRSENDFRIVAEFLFVLESL